MDISLEPCGLLLLLREGYRPDEAGRMEKPNWELEWWILTAAIAYLCCRLLASYQTTGIT
jgi:hypothetical protein